MNAISAHRIIENIFKRISMFTDMNLSTCSNQNKYKFGKIDHVYMLCEANVAGVM